MAKQFIYFVIRLAACLCAAFCFDAPVAKIKCLNTNQRENVCLDLTVSKIFIPDICKSLDAEGMQLHFLGSVRHQLDYVRLGVGPAKFSN